MDRRFDYHSRRLYGSSPLVVRMSSSKGKPRLSPKHLFFFAPGLSKLKLMHYYQYQQSFPLNCKADKSRAEAARYKVSNHVTWV